MLALADEDGAPPRARQPQDVLRDDVVARAEEADAERGQDERGRDEAEGVEGVTGAQPEGESQ